MSDGYTPTPDEAFDATLYTWVDWKGTFKNESDARAAWDRMIAEVRRQATEKAYERGRLDERHDCNRYTEYQQGKIAAEQLQRDLRSRNPYRREETE